MGSAPNSPTERLDAIAKIYRDADELSAELERDKLLRPEFWAPWSRALASKLDHDLGGA